MEQTHFGKFFVKVAYNGDFAERGVINVMSNEKCRDKKKKVKKCEKLYIRK